MWFHSAPRPRFGTFALWGLAGICMGMVSRKLSAKWMIRHQKLILAVVVGILLLPMVDKAARLEFRYRYIETNDMYGKHFYQYYPLEIPTGGSGFPAVPKADLIEATTNSGLKLYVPKLGKDGLIELMWDAPLPTAREFDPNLALRCPGDLKCGFKIVRSQDNKDNGHKTN